ncbi:MAG: AhpC/TSA family protein [Prevotella sp.]|nr:AhpC/TSA family protein [Prevotella sp.]MBQ7414092.1 AhpC/TSA family protein [Prevotella sp.]
MKKNLIIAIAALAMVSCSEKKFHVEGNITNAKDSVLYFENVGLEEVAVVDSVKLDEDGAFSFAQEQTPAPEFYRLRIADQIINVSIDSTETVTVKAQYPQMATQYEISGSDNCSKIKELTLKQINLTQRAIAISQDDALSVDESNDSILNMIKAYKQDVKTNYILKEPNRSYAYFALFQALGNTLIFNPRSDKDDIKLFAAVATSWDTYYPGSERGANLHNIAIEGMKNVRIVAQNEARTIDVNQISATGLIDIVLPDNKGQVRKLSDLKGKVVILDFHLFGIEKSPERIILLRELYNKYQAQGLEIYQVSLDPDEHFWKQQTAALPWVSVRDPQGLDSQTLITYNIQGLPDYFLISRDNALYKRAAQVKDLEAEIRSLL